MALAGRLFLLMLLTSFLLSAVSVPPQSGDLVQMKELTQQKINKLKEGAKAAGKALLSSADTILKGVVPFLQLIPVYGTVVATCVSLALLPVSILTKQHNEKKLLATIAGEFSSINSKLDQYHVEQKWDQWASSAYSKPEMQINIAWQNFKTTVSALNSAKTEDERNRHRQEFIDNYPQSRDATKTLNKLLKARGTTFISNLGDLLAQHLHCHEKELRKFTLFINELIYKGNMMNQFYDKVKGIEAQARVDEEADIAYNVASVMFQIHKGCLSSSMEYVKKEVEAMIDPKKPHQNLANEVRQFLETTYDRYDWMVVAFISRNSGHKILDFMNRHVLTGFTKVPKGEVSVAVARQVKGTHTKAAAIRAAIERCLSKKVVCAHVAQKLAKCKEQVDKVPLSKTYTALHAYIRKAHESTNAQEEGDVIESATSQKPYIYTGKCQEIPGVPTGKFTMLIKSDEELATQDPCFKMNCGGNMRGSCVRVPDVFLAMCECKNPYYGQQCEHRLEDYKKELQRDGGIIVIDNRKRTKPHF